MSMSNRCIADMQGPALTDWVSSRAHARATASPAPTSGTAPRAIVRIQSADQATPIKQSVILQCRFPLLHGARLQVQPHHLGLASVGLCGSGLPYQCVGEDGLCLEGLGQSPTQLVTKLAQFLGASDNSVLFGQRWNRHEKRI